MSFNKLLKKVQHISHTGNLFIKEMAAFQLLLSYTTTYDLRLYYKRMFVTQSQGRNETFQPKAHGQHRNLHHHISCEPNQLSRKEHHLQGTLLRLSQGPQPRRNCGTPYRLFTLNFRTKLDAA